jgi:hypothetical protein
MNAQSKKIPLRKVIKKEVLIYSKLRMTPNTGGSNSSIDFFDLKNSKYTPIPYYKEDRLKKMQETKSKMDLSYLTHFDKRCIVNKQTQGEERDGLFFNKINPIKGINTETRPNAFSWTTDMYNKRIITNMIKAKEDHEKCKLIYLMFNLFFKF